MPRRKLIAGNWKMNTTRAEAVTLAKAVAAGVGASPACDVAVIPPFPWLVPVADALAGTAVALGAQDVYSETKGAFTGEVSPGMLLEVGCKYTLVGHSERRHVIGETDAATNQKVHAALEAGLHVILCIGETLAERERNLQERVFQRQVYAACAGLTDEQFARLIFAYEPVWAIGTGKVATPELAQEAHKNIRARMGMLYGDNIAAALPILYGGSLTGESAPGLFAQPDIDGGLVGGASLKADAFLKIVAAAG
ncbi:triose-phosphate isomerase [Urbifossiella limnaea]|uniref:Triosephosphate isomerase n=1 Tax=Urbifossiella limnaea TaxID=2528023 RepID=A0A517XY35_9BACT|nr:triose-phosphate isomerase [Urbifossiella limnaea]QDU22415.1 Triosephosphate isomerase [Urbifossiella limnaea]